ncbi:MAG: GWxTD domain-containing protein [Bacteroidales bacterium]|nr:GWxTD domain-containing protein [Bacteroidales bacterium]MDD2386374.1 GWxTD domain-containing protein [Bacteroidales bacterium]MDD4215953.1 GWxTD domain-containing protein [Bacteroidales bacterium]MDY0141031.1 GWxTD domain-containing protein [Bacteroidales bacterium]
MKTILSILCFLIISITSFSSLEVYFMYSTFNSPEGPYIETYLSTIGNSANFVKKTNGNFVAELEITIIFRKADSVVAIDKYTLSSPEITDTAANKPNFIDLQRISLQNGIYNFEIQIKDINSEQKAYIFTDIISIDYSPNKLQFSGIQLIEDITPSTELSALTKNGYDLLPYISNFYPSNFHKLSFYTEIYNSDKDIDDNFMVRYYIERFETYQEVEAYSRFKKLNSAPVVPLIGELNIVSLPSGNYNLVIEIKNKTNETMLKSKFFFQRSNPDMDPKTNLADFIAGTDISESFVGDMNSIDSLRLYVACLRPIADMNERNFIDYQLKSAAIDVIKNYFLEFWFKRNNVEPEELWRQYNEQVELVDRNYRTPINRGFETDRGRVYLQYGMPNDIYVSKHEPSSYPYEIWHYYRVLNENNKKFIFYNPNIAGKEYELLHSDLTGEIKSPNWERLLSKRNNTLYNHDNLNSDESWGSRAKQEYDR